MRTTLALLKRELGVYFVSPVAYIILTAMMVVSSLAFMFNFVSLAGAHLPADYGGTLRLMVWVVILASALVTMRLFAEEKNRGTIETLMTAPVTEFQVVFAKFGASVVFLVYLLVLTVFYPIILSMYGDIDVGAVVCGYLGALLVGAMMFSIGIFISSLCSNQITAGIITLVVSLLLLLAVMLSVILDLLSNILLGGLAAGEGGSETGFARFLTSLLNGLKAVLHSFNVTVVFEDFLRGVVDFSQLIFVFSVVAFFLFLTVRVVQSRRWR